MSGIDMPAAVSISLSASVKGSRSRAAIRRPMVDLPAPIIPTSTIDRGPSAAVMSASRLGLVGAGTAVSDIKKLGYRGRFVRIRVIYTTPGDTVTSNSCNRAGNMLDDFIG